MRTLTINEARFISGASNTYDASDPQLNFMLYGGATLACTGIAAELIFMGYCGYHIATTTGVVQPLVGTILGLITPIVAYVTPSYSQKIYNHFTN